MFYVLGHLAELKKNIEIRIERCKIVLDDFKRLIRESRLSRFIARQNVLGETSLARVRCDRSDDPISFLVACGTYGQHIRRCMEFNVLCTCYTRVLCACATRWTHAEVVFLFPRLAYAPREGELIWWQMLRDILGTTTALTINQSHSSHMSSAFFSM